MSIHTYDNVYLKLINAIPCNTCDECSTAESTEHLISDCRKVNIFRQPFSFFNLYNNFYEIFHASNYVYLKQLAAFIKSFSF